MVSGTIKAMLSGKFTYLFSVCFHKSFLIGQFAESRGEVRFPEMPAIVLEKVIQYFYYKVSLHLSIQKLNVKFQFLRYVTQIVAKEFLHLMLNQKLLLNY